MDANETLRIYMLMCAGWRRDPSEAELAVWRMAFEDAPFDKVLEASKRIIREDRPFMPRAGEILTLSQASPDGITYR